MGKSKLLRASKTRSPRWMRLSWNSSSVLLGSILRRQNVWGGVESAHSRLSRLISTHPGRIKALRWGDLLKPVGTQQRFDESALSASDLAKELQENRGRPDRFRCPSHRKVPGGSCYPRYALVSLCHLLVRPFRRTAETGLD